MDENIIGILVKYKDSLDWKRLARGTCINDVDTLVEHIDHDIVDESFKMKMFLAELFQRKPDDYINSLKCALKTMGRNDVLKDLGLGEFLIF